MSEDEDHSEKSSQSGRVTIDDNRTDLTYDKGLINSKNLANHIAYKIARKDYNAVKDAIQFFPLKYRDPNNELGYCSRLSPQHEIRRNLSSIIDVSAIFIIWICCAVGMSLHIFSYGDRLINGILFHVFMIALVCFEIIQVLFGIFTCLAKYTECCVLVKKCISCLAPYYWMLFSLTAFPSSSYAERERLINIDGFFLWTYVSSFGVTLWVLTLLNLLYQTRVISVGGIIAGGIVGVFVTAHQATGSQIDVDDSLFYERHFYYFSGLLNSITILVVGTSSFFGRWYMEMQERIEFWKLTQSIEQLKHLRETQQKRKTKGGSTAVEELLHIATKALSSVQEAEVVNGHPLLVESTELLRQIQNVLTKSDNLYAVKIQAATEEADPEAANLEQKFYQIYADRNQGKRVETAAAEEKFDTTESRREIEKAMVRIRSYSPIPIGSAEFRRSAGRDWNCNILKAYESYPNIIVEMASLLLEPKSEALGISPICIRNYAYRIERLYRPNPYHNKAHGAMVAHTMSCLIKYLDIASSPHFTPINFVAVIVAAMGHDAGHPGRNNQFYIGGLQKLTLLYNDKAALENLHAALVFKSMESASSNIFQELETETLSIMRRQIIDLILATDMSQHFETISKFRLRRPAAGFNYLTEVDDLWLVLRLCIKCADLSHALVDWVQHQEWSVRVTEEFYQQGDEETSMGLPKSPLCDRSLHHDFAKSQKGFIEFVVQPIWSQVDEIDPSDNIAWEELLKERKNVEIPPEIAQMTTNSGAYKLLLKHLFVPSNHQLLKNYQHKIRKFEDEGEAVEPVQRPYEILEITSPEPPTEIIEKPVEPVDSDQLMVRKGSTFETARFGTIDSYHDNITEDEKSRPLISKPTPEDQGLPDEFWEEDNDELVNEEIDQYIKQSSEAPPPLSDKSFANKIESNYREKHKKN